MSSAQRTQKRHQDSHSVIQLYVYVRSSSSSWPPIQSSPQSEKHRAVKNITEISKYFWDGVRSGGEKNTNCLLFFQGRGSQRLRHDCLQCYVTSYNLLMKSQICESAHMEEVHLTKQFVWCVYLCVCHMYVNITSHMSYVCTYIYNI